MKIITLILPWPPSVNHYWRRVGYKTVISKKGREYRKAVESIVAEENKGVKLKGNLHLYIKLMQPDRRRRDVDNFSKAPLDALQSAGVFEDDSQISKATVEKIEPDGDGGRLLIWIKQL